MKHRRISSSESLINFIQQKSPGKGVEQTLDINMIQSLVSGKEIHNINVLLCGDANVGKSSIISRYTKSKFDSIYIESIELEMHKKTFNLNDKTYNYNFFITIGSQRYMENYEYLYKKCDILLFVFDLSNKKSFEYIKKAKINAKKYSKKEQIHVFVGNKNELLEKEISSLNVKKYCKENWIEYFEVSAKNNINIDRMFFRIGEMFNKLFIMNN